MNTKKVLFLFLLICFIAQLSAQEDTTIVSDENEYLIYMKDGSMFRGTIHEEEYSPNEMTIIVDDDIIFQAPLKSIKKITDLRPNYYFLPTSQSFKQAGNYFYVSVGTGLGLRDRLYREVNFQSGRFINPKLALGVGTGLNYLESNCQNNRRGFNFIHMYSHVKVFPHQEEISPFYSLEVGWGILNSINEICYQLDDVEIRRKFEGGLFLKPSIGLRFAARSKSNFAIKLAYNIQNSHFEFKGYDPNLLTYLEQEGRVTLNNLVLEIGWIF